MSLRGRGQITHQRPECLKRPPARYKDASLLKGTSLKPLHTHTHARASVCPASSHGWSSEAIRPRTLSGATSCLHRPQRHPCSRFPLSAQQTPLKSTLLQLEFGRIHLVGGSKSLRLTSFSHVAPFLESLTEKMRLVISCNRILLGSFVFLCPPTKKYVSSTFSQTFKGRHKGPFW